MSQHALDNDIENPMLDDHDLDETHNSDEHNVEDKHGNEEYIWIRYRGEPVVVPFRENATLDHLFSHLASTFGIESRSMKILCAGTLYTYPRDAALPLDPLRGEDFNNNSNKGAVRLLAPPPKELASLHAAAKFAVSREASRATARQRQQLLLQRTTQRRLPQDPTDSKYTFHSVRALPGLSHPERSQKLLETLRNDAGICAVMRKHKLTVNLLMEMEPLAHTSVSIDGGVSRTLGLNRNHGAIIELRLRTDANDGYRDYKTIRRTLCHELAHNRFGDHDRNFWDFCHLLEHEVEAADWRRGGRTLDGFRHQLSPEDVAEDAGVLIQDEERAVGGTSAQKQSGRSRREILARAAEEREQRARTLEKEQRDADTR